MVFVRFTAQRDGDMRWCAASTALRYPSPAPPIPLSPLVSSRSTHGIITVSICLTSYSFLKLSTTR